MTVIEGILAVRAAIPQFNDHGGRPQVQLRKQILLTLWIIGNPECLRSVADRFDVCAATAYREYRRVCKAIVQHVIADYNFSCRPTRSRSH